jgi:hypothetical protein
MTDKSKLPVAKFSGELKIGDMIFPCSVLSDGTRLLTQSDFMKGMGMYYSGWVAKNQAAKDDPADLPHFLAFKSLKPFIDKHLGSLQSITLKYRTERGTIAHGIKAEIIPKLCEVWLDADEARALGTRQKQIAQKAKLLMRALAHIGIIALVDEATGYQEVRDKKALEAILDKYLQDHARTWAKTFPDEFWVKLIKVKGYPSYMALKRPSFVGHWVNDIIYDRIKPGIRKKLNELNPRMPETGRRKKINTQYFTEDYGLPELKDHLKGVMLLMDAAGGSEVQFNRMLNRALPKYGDTIEMPLDSDS